MRRFGAQWSALRSTFAFIALLAVTTGYAQQNVNVVAANSTNNKVLGVTFNTQGGGSTSILNNDAGSLYSLQSLVFVPVNNPNANPPLFSFDLLAADNQKGKVIRYVGDFSTVPPNRTGLIVTTSIPNPTGLSADSAGNVFVLNDTPGHSPNSQVWALRADGSGGLQSPFRVDSTTWGKQQATVESLIVGPPIGMAPSNANSGDLLVLTSNPNTVRRYPGSNGHGPTGPGTLAGTILIGQCPNPQTIPPATNCIPAITASGSPELPAGIAIWPDDNTVLISLSTSGSILQFDLSSGSVVRGQTPFATGPTGLSKIKTGRQGGLARLFVAQSGPGNHGSIIEYGAQAANGPIVALASATTNVMAPLSVAATNAVQQPVSNCAAGCDLLGGAGPNQGVLKHVIEQATSLTGSIVEDVCIVSTDPRYLVNPPPAEGCGDTPQNVNAVCPGFDNTGGTLVIPGYLCGHAGNNGKGFALVRSLTNPDQYDKTYVESSATAANLLPGTSNTTFVCGPPQLNAGIEMFAWAPLAGEGTIIEDTPGPPVMVDITSGCGSSHGGTTHASLWAVGLALDTQASELTSPFANQPLVNFASSKYNNLTGAITSLTPTNITNAVSPSLFNNNMNPLGCIDQSLALFQQAANEAVGPQQTADFQNAANLLTNADGRPANNITCDSIVTNNLSQFIQTTNTNPPVLNPSGQIRSRLANLYYSINTLILGNSGNAVVNNSTWPPAVSVNIDPPTTGTLLSTTLRWNISAGVSNCTLTSSDGAYSAVSVNGSGSTAAIPAATGTPVSYIITCTSPATAATAWATSNSPP
jgi:hypothetical protein